MISNSTARAGWPDGPGIWIRDLRHWPPPQSDREAFVSRVRSEANRVFFGDRRLQALAMACFIREGGASRLAMVALNLYGIIHSIDDQVAASFDVDRYPAIRFGGNDHDLSVGINTRFYRVYDSIEHCLRNWHWHLTGSSHYRHLWPVWQDGRDEEYIRGMRHVWANGNREDPPSVVSLYRSEFDLIGGRAGDAAPDRA